MLSVRLQHNTNGCLTKIAGGEECRILRDPETVGRIDGEAVIGITDGNGGEVNERMGEVRQTEGFVDLQASSSYSAFSRSNFRSSLKAFL